MSTHPHPLVLDEKFWAKVNNYFLPNSCWLWLGAIAFDGYGRCSKHYNISQQAHITLYIAITGDDYRERGLSLDHLCRNRACVNPKHLEPVTAKINTKRGLGPAALNSKKTHCPKGHEYKVPDKNNRRRCGICANETQRRYLLGR